MKISISIGGDEPELKPEVQRLYDKYKDEMGFWSPHAEYNPNGRRFYVYAWFTKCNEKKVFYVGKGTGSRVRHIYTEIRQYEENTGKYKGMRYKQIQDKCGIDYEILIDGITDYEAEIYEYCMIREYTNQGEVLLNFVDMPVDEDEVDDAAQDFEPEIVKDKFYERYLEDFMIPKFDAVERDILLASSFYDAWMSHTDRRYSDREIIKKWVSASGGHVYKNVGKGTKCIIIQGRYPYEHYLVDHENGRMVYSAGDVLKYIQTHKPTDARSAKNTASVPKYDVAVRG